MGSAVRMDRTLQYLVKNREETSHKSENKSSRPNWNKEHFGCLLCNAGRGESYYFWSIGGGPLCRIGALMDKRYIPRLQKLLRGDPEHKMYAIKFKGIKTRLLFIYYKNRKEMEQNLKMTEAILYEIIQELYARGIRKKPSKYSY